MMPHRAVDVKGNRAVASRFLRLRVIDSAGRIILDESVDPEGALEPLKWHRCGMDVKAPHDDRIASVEFYVDMADEAVPWDQRLTFHLDGLAFGLRR